MKCHAIWASNRWHACQKDRGHVDWHEDTRPGAEARWPNPWPETEEPEED